MESEDEIKRNIRMRRRRAQQKKRRRRVIHIILLWIIILILLPFALHNENSKASENHDSSDIQLIIKKGDNDKEIYHTEQSSQTIAANKPTSVITEVVTPEVTQNPSPEITQEPTPEITQNPSPEVTQNPSPEAAQEPTPEVTKEPAPEITEESDKKNKKLIALTFDDGPGARTMELLEFFEENDVRATFFVLGNRLSNRKETIQKMQEIGCQIGNHSNDHMDFTKLTAEQMKQELKVTDDYLVEYTGNKAMLFRPPYGAVNDKVKETVSAPFILWNIDPEDWKLRDTEKVVKAVTDSAFDGGVIVMHDIYGTTIDAVKELIPILKEQGYEFVTISEMAENYGVTLNNGQTYRIYKK